MIVAVDAHGKVIGQVTRLPLNVEVASRTPKMHPERFGDGRTLTILTRNGYRTIPAASVRLEEAA